MIMRPIAAFCLLAKCALLFAQSDSIIYYNHYWKETTRDSAAYYRIAEQKGKIFHVRDYYMSGNLQMEGDYSSLKPEIQNGYFKWYFENGQKFAEGSYVHGKREGIWTFWFPDGLKKEEIKFSSGKEDDYSIIWQSKRQKNSLQIIDRAISEKERGRLEKARALLDSALKVNPFSAEAYYQKGLLELEAGENGCDDLEKARGYWYFDMMELNKVIEDNCVN